MCLLLLVLYLSLWVFFVYRLNFNDNTGDIHVIGNLIEYKLGELHCEGGSYNELDVLCDDSFVVF